MNNFLTVIIPIYNDGDNIERCLKSLFNQTLKQFNIIVVNDASTDNTLNILISYQKKFPFKIINMKKNSGAGCCRNIGLQEANTPYITFVDSDDWLDISVYEKCAEQITKNPDVINFGLCYDYVNFNYIETKYKYSKKYIMSGEFALNIYAHTIPNEIKITPIVNNKVYRKQFLVENDILFQQNIRYQEDDIFTFETLMKADKVIFIDNCNYHYCQRKNSLIHNVSQESIYSFIKAYKTLETKLISNKSFDKYKKSFYLKLKSSLLGVTKRTIDYEPNIIKRNQLIYTLITLLHENFDGLELLETIDFSRIREILK